MGSVVLLGTSHSDARKVRVLIVDDTATIRRLLRALLADDPRIEIVGEAGDPYEARALIKSLNPDVLTLDVEMPRMNGLVFLEKIMRLRPMPVIMVSSRTVEDSEEAVTALSLGALDCVDLRRLRSGDPRLPDLGDMLVTAARARVRGQALADRPKSQDADGANRAFDWNGRSVVVGSSTGGVDALLNLFGSYPPNGPPTVVAQHMPSQFLESFATRLNTHSPATVRLARDGDVLTQGEVLLAPGGGFHAVLRNRGELRVSLVADTGEDLYVPSVARLFSSAAPLGNGVVGVMLTGMGRDGAAELLDMRNAGASTIAQSGRSAVVDGMPKAARELGAAEAVLDLSDITPRILALTSSSERIVSRVTG